MEVHLLVTDKIVAVGGVLDELPPRQVRPLVHDNDRQHLGQAAVPRLIAHQISKTFCAVRVWDAGALRGRAAQARRVAFEVRV